MVKLKVHGEGARTFIRRGEGGRNSLEKIEVDTDVRIPSLSIGIFGIFDGGGEPL